MTTEREVFTRVLKKLRDRASRAANHEFPNSEFIDGLKAAIETIEKEMNQPAENQLGAPTVKEQTT